MTGSIDTREIDSFRQGVELVTSHHFAAGIARIWSGYPEHECEQTEFGQASEFSFPSPFEEQMKFDTVAFLTCSSLARKTFSRQTSAVISRIFDGALHPLGHPSGSIDGFAREVRGIKGALVSGNENIFGESDSVIDFYTTWYNTGSCGPFIDSNAVVMRSTYISGRIPAQASVSPYRDNFPAKPGIITSPSASVEFIAARLAMSGTDLNTRIPSGSKSMTSGFTYDKSTYGTDSVSFGGFKF